MAAKEKEKDDDEVKNASEGEEGAEGTEGTEGDAAAAKKKKIIILVGAVIMLLLLGGAGAYFAGVFGHGKESMEAEADKAKAEGEAVPVFFDLPQILVNLNTGTKSVSFIKTTITLELNSKEDVPMVEANLPRLMDSYNTFLREMKAADLYGSAGIYRLREEMLIRANKMLAPVKVKDVLFREILVQ